MDKEANERVNNKKVLVLYYAILCYATLCFLCCVSVTLVEGVANRQGSEEEDDDGINTEKVLVLRNSTLR